MRPNNQGRKGQPYALTDEQIERIIQLHEEGSNRLQIQNQTGVSQPSIRKVLREAGYEIQDSGTRTRITKELKQQVIELRNAGWTFQAIANHVGIAKRSAMNIVADHANDVGGRGEAVSPETFIKAWQGSDNPAEVSVKLNMKMQAVLSRAFGYRQRGVPLKKFKFGGHYNWDDLKEFAELFLEDGDADN